MIRVLLADDQALIRAGFRVLLEAADDIEVIGEAVNGDQAVELAKAERPDVILMDIRMPGTDGLAATSQIAAADALERGEGRHPDHLRDRRVRVPGAARGRERLPRQGRRAGGADPRRPRGAQGRGAAVAERDPPPDRLAREPGAGSGRRPGRDHGNRARPASDLARLTEREREVLALVAQGLSNEEIAARLYLSPLTTKTHVSHIMTKLGARDRAQLVVIAYESGPGRPRRHRRPAPAVPA